MNKPLLVGVILILFFLFYWFQYRPAEVRRECVKYASESVKAEDDAKIDIDKYIKANDFIYQECLRTKGLK